MTCYVYLILRKAIGGACSGSCEPSFKGGGEGTMCSRGLKVGGQREPLNLRREGREICIYKWVLREPEQRPEGRCTVGATLAIQVARCT